MSRKRIAIRYELLIMWPNYDCLEDGTAMLLWQMGFEYIISFFSYWIWFTPLMQNASGPLIKEAQAFHDLLLPSMLIILYATLRAIIFLCKPRVTHRALLESNNTESIWTLLPICFMVALCMPSLRLLYLFDEACEAYITNKVVGYQWYWSYDYGDICYDSYLEGSYINLETDNRLFMPFDTGVQLLITANDVLHAWTIPTLAIKADAVPGRVNKLITNVSRSGIYYGQCREICGRMHRFMPIAMECYFNLYFALKAKRIRVKITLFQLLIVTLSVAFYTLLERKMLGYMQTRVGPNKPRLGGVLVPLADALKLIGKEFRRPTEGNKWIFFLVPSFTLIIPLLIWIAYPSWYQPIVLKFSVMWFLCISSIGVYAIMCAGWRSNRKYAIFGALRAVAQSVSYEVSLAMIVMHCVFFFYYKMMIEKMSSLCLWLSVLILFFFVSALAETNRTPFDFSEGESELVSGFNTEFSSVPFILIFLAEYMTILFMSCAIRLLFNMTTYFDLFLFAILWSMLFICTRGTLPRFRYDQLMIIAWKSFLPFVLCTFSVILN